MRADGFIKTTVYLIGITSLFGTSRLNGEFYINRTLKIYVSNVLGNRTTEGIYPINIGGMPPLEQCLDEAALKVWQIDKDEQDDEFLNLKKAICLFHRQSYGIHDPSTRDAQIAGNDQIIELLRASQNEGLPIPHKNHAALMESMLHCRQAKNLYPKYQDQVAAGQNYRDTLDIFCQERRLASQSFSEIDWSVADGDYTNFLADVPKDSFTTLPIKQVLVKEILECFATGKSPLTSPLGPGDGNIIEHLCITPKVTEADIDAAIEVVMAHRVEPKYFASASPLSAMILRKATRIEKATTVTQEDIDELKEKETEAAAEVKTNADAYNEHLEAANSAVENYKYAVTTAFAVDDEIETWKDAVLKGRETDTEAPKVRITKEHTKLDLLEEDPELNTQKSAILGLYDQVFNVIDWSKRKEHHTKELCQIYFCEVMRHRHREDRRVICDNPKFRAENILCQGVETIIPSPEDQDVGILEGLWSTITRPFVDEGKSLKSLCVEAGFNPEFIKENRRVTDQDSCLSTELTAKIFQDRKDLTAKGIDPATVSALSQLKVTAKITLKQASDRPQPGETSLPTEEGATTQEQTDSETPTEPDVTTDEESLAGEGDQASPSTPQSGKDKRTTQMQAPSERISISYYYTLLDGGKFLKKNYVAIMNPELQSDETGEMTAYRLEDCNETQAKELFGLAQGAEVDGGVFYWLQFWWRGLYSNPYISCKAGNIDYALLPKTYNQNEVFVFYKQNKDFYTQNSDQNTFTYYIPYVENFKKPLDSPTYYALHSKCLTLKENLGLVYPNRRFRRIGAAPIGKILPILCVKETGRQLISADYWDLLDKNWYLRWIPPEYGWSIKLREGEKLEGNCAAEPKTRVGAFVLSYKDEIFLPIIKANGCYLNENTYLDHKAKGKSTFQLIREQLKKYMGIPPNIAITNFPLKKKSLVNKFPFLEICIDCSPVQKQRLKRFIYRSDEKGRGFLTSLAEVEETMDVQRVANIVRHDGSRKYYWTFPQFVSRDTDQIIQRTLSWDSCSLDFLNNLGILAKLIKLENNEWYTMMNMRRMENIGSDFSYGQITEVPCFNTQNCVREVTDQASLKAVISNPTATCQVLTGRNQTVLEIRVTNDIILTEPLTIYGHEINEGNEFEKIILTSAAGAVKTITTDISCKDDRSKDSHWCKEHYRSFMKVPIFAFIEVPAFQIRNLKFNRSTGDQSDTGIFVYGSRLAVNEIEFAADKNPLRTVFARNESELYIYKTKLYAQRTAVTAQNSRISLTSSEVQGKKKGVHITNDAELFLYDSKIFSPSPLFLKGRNLDSTSSKNLDAHETHLEYTGLPTEANPCVSVQWGANASFSQIRFICNKGILYRDAANSADHALPEVKVTVFESDFLSTDIKNDPDPELYNKWLIYR